MKTVEILQQCITFLIYIGRSFVKDSFQFHVEFSWNKFWPLNFLAYLKFVHEMTIRMNSADQPSASHDDEKIDYT